MTSLLELVDDYADSVKIGQIVYRNLCNSCAHAEIACDPLVCEPKLIDAWRWARTTDYTIKGFAGSCKMIYRDYARVEAARESARALAFRSAARGVFDEDE